MRKLIFLVAIIFVIFLTAVQGLADVEKLVFGITPWFEPAEMREAYKPLMDYIEEKLGIKTTFIVTKNYPELGRLIKEGKIDIGFFTPVAYVEAKNEDPSLRYILTFLFDEGRGIKEHYHGYIIVREDSPYKSIEDLKGKRFAFTSKGSSSGYKYPMVMFKSMAIEPAEYFGNVFFLKSHPGVIKAVTKDTIDGGATWEGALHKAKEEYGDIYRIIKKTEPIPFDAVACRKDLDDSVVQRLKEILLPLKPDSTVFQKSTVRGFLEKGDNFYNVVRKVVKMGEKERIVLGTEAWYDEKIMKEIFQPLTKHLEKELKKKVIFVTTKSYDDLGKFVKEGKIDIAFFSPVSYVKAKKDNPQLKYLLTALEDRKGELVPFYKGCIVVKKDSPYKEIKDLEGKRFAFTDKASSSGFQFPMFLFKSLGIEPFSFFEKVFFLKKHTNVTTAIANDRIDAGTTFYANPDLKKGGFRVIAETEPIPLDVLAVSDEFDKQMVNKIKEIFLNLKPDSYIFKNSKLHYRGFVEKDDSFYNVVRKVIEEVEKKN